MDDGLFYCMSLLLTAGPENADANELYKETHYDRFFELFPSFPDSHTVALWLFDDPEYYLSTLTDASLNRYDMRLKHGGSLMYGHLMPGKWGGAFFVNAHPAGTIKFPTSRDGLNWTYFGTRPAYILRKANSGVLPSKRLSRHMV